MNNRNNNKKQPKPQHEVIDLISDDEHDVVNLVSDSDTPVQKKPVNKHHKKANKSVDITKSPARLAPARNRTQNTEATRQQLERDLARRKHKQVAEMRRRLTEAMYDSDEDDAAASENYTERSAEDEARRKVHKTAGNRLKAMWAQLDEKSYR